MYGENESLGIAGKPYQGIFIRDSKYSRSEQDDPNHGHRMFGAIIELGVHRSHQFSQVVCLRFHTHIHSWFIALS
jgi:hypothetical protein